jgi:hypothetical protein
MRVVVPVCFTSPDVAALNGNVEEECGCAIDSVVHSALTDGCEKVEFAGSLECFGSWYLW